MGKNLSPIPQVVFFHGGGERFYESRPDYSPLDQNTTLSTVKISPSALEHAKRVGVSVESITYCVNNPETEIDDRGGSGRRRLSFKDVTVVIAADGTVLAVFKN